MDLRPDRPASPPLGMTIFPIRQVGPDPDSDSDGEHELAAPSGARSGGATVGQGGSRVGTSRQAPSGAHGSRAGSVLAGLPEKPRSALAQKSTRTGEASVAASSAAPGAQDAVERQGSSLAASRHAAATRGDAHAAASHGSQVSSALTVPSGKSGSRVASGAAGKGAAASRSSGILRRMQLEESREQQERAGAHSTAQRLRIPPVSFCMIDKPIGELPESASAQVQKVMKARNLSEYGAQDYLYEKSQCAAGSSLKHYRSPGAESSVRKSGGLLSRIARSLGGGSRDKPASLPEPKPRQSRQGSQAGSGGWRLRREGEVPFGPVQAPRIVVTSETSSDSNPEPEEGWALLGEASGSRSAARGRPVPPSRSTDFRSDSALVQSTAASRAASGGGGATGSVQAGAELQSRRTDRRNEVKETRERNAAASLRGPVQAFQDEYRFSRREALEIELSRRTKFSFGADDILEREDNPRARLAGLQVRHVKAEVLDQWEKALDKLDHPPASSES
ncbi:hypothetical protein GT347_02675 [Xylophilus rhododendri]|uniref:Uncharacterized protein n=1 Tax=Xylophilus rhododendri TaxID=2697032 RepID=A0A857J286_9BURK|nr:hypothetical protein [Xylophilus rhododendri]QHI96985.1 hypothetical protein GT347_02675 [Xylophilus rhododendri]